MAEKLQPHYFTRDVERFVAFWTHALGFQVVVAWPETGPPAWAELRLGDQAVMVGGVPPEGSEQDDGVWREIRARLGHGGALTTYVAVEDVDAHFGRARAAGATVLSEPADKWYGLREYVARDPDGNLVSIYRPKG